MNSATSYWKARKAREASLKAIRAEHAERDFWARVERNAVASILPNASMPAELEAFPVCVHMANGSRLVCNYLN